MKGSIDTLGFGRWARIVVEDDYSLTVETPSYRHEAIIRRVLNELPPKGDSRSFIEKLVKRLKDYEIHVLSVVIVDDQQPQNHQSPQVHLWD